MRNEARNAKLPTPPTLPLIVRHYATMTAGWTLMAEGTRLLVAPAPPPILPQRQGPGTVSPTTPIAPLLVTMRNLLTMRGGSVHERMDLPQPTLQITIMVRSCLTHCNRLHFTTVVYGLLVVMV